MGVYEKARVGFEDFLMNHRLVRRYLLDSLMISSMRVPWLSLLMGFYGSSFLGAAEPIDGLAAIAVLAEGNCVACHEAPELWRPLLPLKPASDLSGVGSRLSSTSLRRYLGPGGVDQAGVHDPVVLAGGLVDDDTRDALVAYLSSLREEAPEMVEGDAGRGRALYHNIGCVACHEPEGDIGDAGPSDGSNRKPLVTPSVPMTLAKEYGSGVLAQFLRDPLVYRPAGRMPSFHLLPREAADLAFFLQGESKIPAPLESAHSPEIIGKGRDIFIKSRCHHCHANGEALEKLPSLPLVNLSFEKGCVGSKSGDGHPHYPAVERRVGQFREAVAALSTKPPTVTVADQIERHFTQWNCYACHVRGGKGGPEPGRAAFFTSTHAAAESLGDMSRLPPNLDHVGRKLTRNWFEKILWGTGGSVRQGMQVRMPQFGRAQTEPLIALLEQADRRVDPVTIDTSGLLRHQRAETGRKLLGITGLGCVSCHGMKDRPSLGPPSISLTHTAERLRPEYFKELLLDPQGTQAGTLMPPLFSERKKAGEEIESLWIYFKDIHGQPLPEGLLQSGDYEIKPEVEGRPMVFRSFVEGVGTHAIAVGFPEGLHACFDAKSCRWKLRWRGRFLDALSNWQDRMMPPVKPLGDDVIAMPPEEGERSFRGYRLNKDGRPVMLYEEKGAEIEDSVAPGPDGKSLVRTRKRGSELISEEVLPW